jgi:hypothetical protein
MYNHLNQYRCTIIRGKSQKEMDDLLPAYAKIVDDICPCKYDDFNNLFNIALLEYTPGATKKTLDNHRTEIVGKLFGMYYLAEDGFVYSSERTQKYIEDNDQPAFFKDICFKMQFPNGMDKSNTIIERKSKNINIRQYPYILKTLMIAKNAGITLTKNDIGYYILNSLDVLQRKATPLEVIEQISSDKKIGLVRKVQTSGKASSFDMQHINEQINYLELANLVIVNQEGEVFLNDNEINTIEYFAEFWNDMPLFNVYSYGLDSVENRKRIGFDWDYYYSKLSNASDKFATTAISLGIPAVILPPKGRTDLTEIGDEGELYVFEYEKQRVKTFDKRLSGKVLHLGKTKGLGYDIQSVIAEKGELSEFVKYIEVKSTKRVTAPDIDDPTWVDTINITRNEWVAAKQHKDFYSIFRVYFVRGNVIMYVIENINQKAIDEKIKVIPMTYRLDFDNKAIDAVIAN